MAYDNVVARITLAGSMTSCIATFLVLLAYVCFRDQHHSFRHTLVLNLAAAEFINTLNNSISGFIYVKNRKLDPGPACTLNGFVGQLTVQAVDFTILAIVLVTLLTITRKTYLPGVSVRAKALICAATWLVPVITSTVAVSLKVMKPVSGNWCWISAERPDLRYGLTHGWRIAIIFITVLLYAYIWWFVHRHFKSLFGSGKGTGYAYNPVTGAVHTEYTRSRKENLKISQGTTLVGDSDTIQLSNMKDVTKSSRESRDDSALSDISLPIQGAEEMSGVERGSTSAPSPAYVRQGETRLSYSRLFCIPEINKPETSPRVRLSFDVRVSFAQKPCSGLPPGTPTAPLTPITPHTETKITSASCTSTSTSQPRTQEPASQPLYQAHKVEKEIRRMLLLNAYPTLYVLLWIPGLVNRFMEATGTKPSNSLALAALQSTTQFVGFANALTFGLNAIMRRRIGSATARAAQSWRAKSDAWRKV